MKMGALLILTSLAGCGAGPDISDEMTDSEYRRAEERLRITEEYEMRKEACNEAGGSMRVARGTNARQPPRLRDLRRATCERRGFRTVY